VESEPDYSLHQQNRHVRRHRIHTPIFDPEGELFESRTHGHLLFLVSTRAEEAFFSSSILSISSWNRRSQERTGITRLVFQTISSLKREPQKSRTCLRNWGAGTRARTLDPPATLDSPIHSCQVDGNRVLALVSSIVVSSSILLVAPRLEPSTRIIDF